MTTMRKTLFLTEEDNKDVLDYMNRLIEKNAQQEEYIESGDILLRVEDKNIIDNKVKWLFSIQRTIGYIEKDVYIKGK